MSEAETICILVFNLVPGIIKLTFLLPIMETLSCIESSRIVIEIWNRDANKIVA